VLKGDCTIHIIAPGKSDSQYLAFFLTRHCTTACTAAAIVFGFHRHSCLSNRLRRAVVPVITSSMAVITVEMVITILGTDFHCRFCKRHFGEWTRVPP